VAPIPILINQSITTQKNIYMKFLKMKFQNLKKISKNFFIIF
jgi:hypothetical protein